MDERRSRLEREVERALRGVERVVLAVSGGRDSMVLLHAAARIARERVVAVATFDHGTGAAATSAAQLVAERAAALGMVVERGESRSRLHGEAAWRAARWRFLREVAARHGALVATAHTRDDQVETVLMRAMRDAGARGMAGLYARTAGVVRPLVDVGRAEVARYAERHAVAWIDDPSNADLAYLRNRVRHELLPALTRARPTLPRELLSLARRAARWRAAVERIVDETIPYALSGRSLAVARGGLRRYDPGSLRVIWPALASRVGITLDHRGTRRLASFTMNGTSGGRIQLSGGHEVVLHRDLLQLRAAPEATRRHVAVAWDPQPLAESVTLSAWRFRRGDAAASTPAPDDRWAARLPAARRLTVRSWRPGDRMVPAGAATARRVKGLLRAAGVAGPDRPGWPVVLADGEIVWIPGVRRGVVAELTEGEGSVFICERIGD